MMDTTRHIAAGLLPGDVASMTDDAVEQLDKHQLADAERLFHRVLQAGVDDSVTEAKCAITCLLGLGQLYMKQARSQRHVELEWHRVCLQAIASLQLATELCDDVASRYLDTDLQLWLTQNRNKAAGHRKVLESIILKSLLQKFADKGKCKQETFDCSWLATLRAHYKSKAQQFLTKAMFSSSDESGTDDEAPAEERKTTAAKQDKLSKVDFNKLHKVIQNLVKQISADMRRRYLRKKLSEKTLRRSISSELIAMPQEDILTLFEEAIIPDEPDSESNNQKVTAPATPSNDSRLSMDSVLEHQENDGKLDHTEATHSASHDSETTTATIVKLEVSSARRCPENGGDGQHECSTTTDATASVAEEVDSKEVQNSVLSAWRRYKEQCPLRLPAPPYHPPGSVATTPTLDMAVTLVGSPPSSPRGVAPLIKSPLSDSVLDQALANMLIHVADKLHEGGDETKLHIAYELYNYALAMYQETGFSTAHALVVGRVLKQLGLIDCQRGDLAAGSEIVHEAIELLILANTGSADDPLDVSRAWFQLGNAYVENHCREGALLFHILELVKREIEMPDVDENAANADSSKSDLTNIHEAIACYNRALAIVSLLRRQNKCCHTQFYVSVLTKLGDCSIIVGGSGRDRSVLCYEEALCLSKYTFGSASLRDNAHILSMLGMSNFLLEHYPKAVSMFETANVLQQHCCGGDDADFETAFNRTMLAICHYVTKYYYKCVVWCLRAFEVYDLLYVNKLKSIPPLKRWFIVRTLYTLGYSYSTLNFNCKALHYLELCRHIISQTNEPPERRDVPHLVRVLKVTGDIYASTDELHLAGEYYTEALESCALLGGAHNSTNALHNQLLNCLASVHVTTKEYSSAAEYLEQALSHQKNVQSHIASDLVGLLGQLARTYTLAGDVDRAIECASECIDAYDDKSSAGVRSKAQQLCSLATLYYVEACLSDDIDFDEELGMRSERCFKQACRLCPDSVVSVQYANFLYQRGDDARALIAMLPFIYDDGIRHLAGEKRNVAYIGVEQAILPEHLHHELDDIDESVLDALVFGRFLAILCYKQLYLEKDAEDCLNELAAIVSESPVALNHAILAYSYMELAMFEKAAISFAHAAFLKCDNSLALTNFWICCCLSAFQGITNAMFAVYASTRVESIAVAPVGGIPMYDEPAAPIAMKDSGYYDSAVELSEHLPPEESLSHVTGAVGGRSGTRERFSCVEEISSNEMMESLMEEKFDDRTSSLVDLGYTSNEYLAQESATANHETHQGWTSEEVLVNSQKVSNLNVTEQRHCDIPISERSKTYLYEMKMSVSPSDHGYLNVEHLPEASPPQFSPTRLEHEEAGDGNADDDVFNEWWSEEVVVETPPEVLDMIRQRNMAKESTSSVDSEESPGKNMAESPTEVDEEFTVWEVEETVQTPAAILQVIQQQQQQQHQLQSQYEVTCNFTISSQKAGIVVDNNNLHLAQHHTAIEFGKTNNSNEVWIEETVNPATTMAILNYVNGNGQHTSSTPDEQNGNLNTSRGENEREEDGVEESNEVWETWEETVETPPEILRAIMANQHC